MSGRCYCGYPYENYVQFSASPYIRDIVSVFVRNDTNALIVVTFFAKEGSIIGNLIATKEGRWLDPGEAVLETLDIPIGKLSVAKLFLSIFDLKTQGIYRIPVSSGQGVKASQILQPENKVQ